MRVVEVATTERSAAQGHSGTVTVGNQLSSGDAGADQGSGAASHLDRLRHSGIEARHAPRQLGQGAQHGPLETRDGASGSLLQPDGTATQSGRKRVLLDQDDDLASRSERQVRLLGPQSCQALRQSAGQPGFRGQEVGAWLIDRVADDDGLIVGQTASHDLVLAQRRAHYLPGHVQSLGCQLPLAEVAGGGMGGMNDGGQVEGFGRTAIETPDDTKAGGTGQDAKVCANAGLDACRLLDDGVGEGIAQFVRMARQDPFGGVELGHTKVSPLAAGAAVGHWPLEDVWSVIGPCVRMPSYHDRWLADRSRRFPEANPQPLRLSFRKDHGEAPMTCLPSLTLVLLLAQTAAPEARPETVNEQLARCWADLGSEDAVVSATAVSRMVAAAKEAVPYLRQRLQGCGSTEKERRVAALLADLDSDDFEVRDRATRELQGVREEALVQLQSALRDARSPEVRLRLRLILGNRAVVEGVKSAEQRRLEKVVRILELVATPEAREMLTTLAQTDPDAGLRRRSETGFRAVEGKGTTLTDWNVQRGRTLRPEGPKECRWPRSLGLVVRGRAAVGPRPVVTRTGEGGRLCFDSLRQWSIRQIRGGLWAVSCSTGVPPVSSTVETPVLRAKAPTLHVFVKWTT